MKRMAQFLAPLAIATCAWGSAGTLPVDGFAAKVNDRVITIGEVIAYVQPTEQQLRDRYSGVELQKKREEAFESGLQALIDRALILEDFKLQQGQLPERVINDRVNELVRDKFKGDRIAFQQALIDEGITLDEWRTETRERIVVSILRRQEVSEKVKLSASAVRELYEQRKAGLAIPARARLHVISIRLNPEDPDAAREKAIVARGKVLAGDDFEDVATGYSDGHKAESGGDWGWIETDSLRPELKAAVEKTPVGGISDLVETDDAFYILRVDERQAAGFKSFEEMLPQLTEELRQAEADRLYKDWMQRLRRKHFVQIF